MLLQNVHPVANSDDKRPHHEQEPAGTVLAGNKRARPDDYTDHANDPIAQDYSPSTSGTFPFILHTLLDEVHDIGLSSIVSWRPHGRAFLVHNPEAFVEHVMKLYFKQTQITSFIRQLNIYGFKRLHTGRDAGGYYHEYFLRDRIDLCSKIRRMKLKGGPAPNLPMREPNFYEMPPVGVCKEASIKTPGEKESSESEVVSSSDGCASTSSTRDSASTVSSSSDEKKEQTDRKDSETSASSSEERTSIMPSTRDSSQDQSSSDTAQHDLMPRPLPPLFDTASVGAVQFPGTWRTMEIGNERWVFHLTASRSSSSTLGSSSRNNDFDSNGSGSSNGGPSARNLLPFPGMAGLEQQHESRGSFSEDNESEETDPILQLAETLLKEDHDD